ncbi:hypothetical protein [Methanobrevibacter sp.]|uniref:hypothetical protein n=1 Tax=Methanobrevibacter sp. TaxID=66852 RepID=UPI00388E8BF7
MKFKTTTLFIILFISVLSLTTVNASDDIIQNTTDQISINDDNAILSDVYPIAYDYPTSESTVMLLDDEGDTPFAETICTVGPTNGIALNASYSYTPSDGFKAMIYSTSRGTYNPSTGIWDIGDFYGEESLKVFSYNEHYSQSWEDFIKTDGYPLILQEYAELNQTNILVNPDAVDRMPHIIDLSLTAGDFIGTIPPGSEIASCHRSFTVKSEGGVAENTTVEYVLDKNFTFQYYEASKGSYDPTTGIWDVGDVSDSETLTVYTTVDMNYLLSIIGKLWDERNIIARTTSNEIYTGNNFLDPRTNSTIVTKSDDKSYSHQQHYSYSDYSEYRTVNVVDDDGETKEVSYSEYKHGASAPENTNPSTNPMTTNSTEDTNPSTNPMTTNSTDIRENASSSANNRADTNDTEDSIENFTRTSNIDKSINPSNGNILIILAVLILGVFSIVVFKKFKS